MPSRKQRRRREKLKRHDYEYVVETDEGEVPVERLRELEEETPARKDGKTRAPAEPVDRRGRPIPKPSLERVLKRTAIFAPILIAFVFFLPGSEEATTTQKLLSAAPLLAFFIPLSYLVDVLVYRMLMRRTQRDQAAGRRPR